MKQKNHLALAEFLLGQLKQDHPLLKKPLRRAFIWGNLLPDYIPLTYMRGILKSRGMKGHHAPFSKREVERIIRARERKGLSGFWSAFSLGALMHYLADSFTYSHSLDFEGNTKAHNGYERALATEFGAYIKAAVPPPLPEENLFSYLNAKREAYGKEAHTMAVDCRYILEVCSAIFGRLTLV